MKIIGINSYVGRARANVRKLALAATVVTAAVGVTSCAATASSAREQAIHWAKQDPDIQGECLGEEVIIPKNTNDTTLHCNHGEYGEKRIHYNFPLNYKETWDGQSRKLETIEQVAEQNNRWSYNKDANYNN